MLTAARLTRRFDRRLAVKDLSFALPPGEIFALLGPNGAGKTTTLRMLAGLIEPTSGQVIVDGEPMSRSNASELRGRIGFLTEAPGLWDRLTVRQNLMTYAELQGLVSPSRAVDAALDLFDLRDRAMEPAVRLSKGLKQRVALARTRCIAPISSCSTNRLRVSIRAVRVTSARWSFGCATKGAWCCSRPTTSTRSSASPAAWPCSTRDWSPATRRPRCAPACSAPEFVSA
ncbi:MAG: ABC transporter ATP-binding protein [Acidobacteria bacterium]|nr:ABC transporter ATP-binding protein [Acidobacteriota bacterium]